MTKDYSSKLSFLIFWILQWYKSSHKIRSIVNLWLETITMCRWVWTGFLRLVKMRVKANTFEMTNIFLTMQIHSGRNWLPNYFHQINNQSNTKIVVFRVNHIWAVSCRVRPHLNHPLFKMPSKPYLEWLIHALFLNCRK